MAAQAPWVGVIMGSRTDWDTLGPACELLDELAVPYEARIVSAHDGEKQQRYPDQRSFQHAAWSNVAQIKTDEDRNRNRREHGRGSPGTVLHRIHDDEPEHCDQDQHDHERADDRRVATDRTELIASHLPEAPPVSSRREKQDRHVLHAAAEHGADENPYRAGKKPELRRERRAD